MLLLPSYTWTVDPVFWRIPNKWVALTVASVGLLMLLYGFYKKEREQMVTGAVFAAAAGLISSYMGGTIELRYYSLLFVVVFLGGHALLTGKSSGVEARRKSLATSSCTACWAY